MKNKINRYLISGAILTYFGLKDDDFIIYYNGIALAAGIIAFIFAFIEYQKSKKQD